MPMFSSYTRMEGVVVSSLVAFLALLVVGVAVGYLNLTYLLYLLSLSGMYILLSLGLNVQWGYAGLINFSVAAFFGIGAYGAALLTANASPIAGNFGPLVGLLGGLLAAAVLAVLIGVPTLRLRADYLAIASLGLAEVVRRVILNEQQWTQGSAGLTGIPLFFSNWPVLGSFTEPLLVAILNVALVAVFIAICYLFLRRLHRSPWGRVLRTIRSDEDLAKALGKNTYAFRMQAFVIGSIIMALGGVFYVNLTLYIDPNALRPIRTFYVWVAVILGGSGSDSGAMFGGFAIIAILEGTRFLNNVIAFSLNTAALRLLLTGVLIIAIMRLRPEGILPPHRELIWPSALEGEQDE